uniref:uncharacterized protein n=1 Tax=Myxine glutinosa TaxID=7769 RepID=UPI00358E084C
MASCFTLLNDFFVDGLDGGGLTQDAFPHLDFLDLDLGSIGLDVDSVLLGLPWDGEEEGESDVMLEDREGDPEDVLACEMESISSPSSSSSPSHSLEASITDELLKPPTTCLLQRLLQSPASQNCLRPAPLPQSRNRGNRRKGTTRRCQASSARKPLVHRAQDDDDNDSDNMDVGQQLDSLSPCLVRPALLSPIQRLHYFHGYCRSLSPPDSASCGVQVSPRRPGPILGQLLCCGVALLDKERPYKLPASPVSMETQSRHAVSDQMMECRGGFIDCEDEEDNYCCGEKHLWFCSRGFYDEEEEGKYFSSWMESEKDFNKALNAFQMHNGGGKCIFGTKAGKSTENSLNEVDMACCCLGSNLNTVPVGETVVKKKKKPNRQGDFKNLSLSDSIPANRLFQCGAMMERNEPLERFLQVELPTTAGLTPPTTPPHRPEDLAFPLPAEGSLRRRRPRFGDHDYCQRVVTHIEGQQGDASANRRRATSGSRSSHHATRPA